MVVNAGEYGWGVGLEDWRDSYYNCGDIKFVGGKVTVNGMIATKYHSIYVDDVNKGSKISASSNKPFVYPVPQQ